MPHLYRAERFRALEDVCAFISDYRDYYSDYSGSSAGVRREISKIKSSLNRLKRRFYPSKLEKIDILFDYQDDQDDQDDQRNLNIDEELDIIAETLLMIINRDDTKFTIPYLKGALRAQITGSVFTPFWHAANNFLIQTYCVKNASLYTQKYPVLKILSSLPLLNDIYYVNDFEEAMLKQDIVSNLILTLLNPVKMLNSLLKFVELSANRILEVGLTAEDNTPPIRIFLKGLVGLAATIIRIPLTILQPFSDILPVVVNNLVIQPVKYIKNKVFSPAGHDDPDNPDVTTSWRDDFSMNSDDEPEFPLHPSEVRVHRKSDSSGSSVSDARVSRGGDHRFFGNVSNDGDEEEKFPHDEQNRQGPGNWGGSGDH